MNEIELRAQLRWLMAQLSATMVNAGTNSVVVARLTGARTLVKSAHDVIKVNVVEQEETEETESRR